MKREIQIEITRQCVLNCIHCSSSDLKQLSPHDRLFGEHLIHFLKQLGGENHVYLTGGDPLCLDSLPQLCKLLKDIKGVDIGLFTNGLLKNNTELQEISINHALNLKENGIKDCYISLYSSTASVHNSITNSNTFDLTCKSIKNLILTGVETNAHIVLSKTTVSNLNETIHFAQQLGMKSVRILHLVKAGNAIDNWFRIGLPNDEQEEHILEILNIYKEKPFKVTVSGYPHIVPCRPASDAIGCQMGNRLLYITYDGSIYPCACTKKNENFKIGCIQNVNEAIVELRKYNNVPYLKECANKNYSI